MAKQAKDFSKGFAGILDGIASTDEQAPASAELEALEAPTAEGKPAQKQRAARPSAGKRGRPHKVSTEQEQRATLIINTDILQRIKEIAYRETGRQGQKVLIKDIIAEALTNYIEQYDRQAGK